MNQENTDCPKIEVGKNPPDPLADARSKNIEANCKILSTEFHVITEIMDMRTCLDSRRAGLRTRLCVLALGDWTEIVHTNEEIRFLSPKMKFEHKDISAGVFTVAEILDKRDKIENQSTICLLDESILAQAPKVRRFNMEDSLSKTIVNLARISPKNKSLQGHLMALFGRMPPAEAETFEQLRDWMEFGFDLPLKNELNMNYFADPGKPKIQSQDVANRVAFHLDADETAQESGRCFFSRTRTSYATVAIRSSDLMGWIDEDASMDELVGLVIEKVEDDFSDGNTGSDEYDNEDYYDYSVEDCGSSEITISNQNRIRSHIEDFIRENFDEVEANEIINS